MSRPLRVFLCHASQDKPAVRKLHRYLKQRGVQPWLDQLDLLPGENWEVEIPKALFSSDVILVCLSKNSVDKEGYVQKEITFALDKALEKPEGTIFIVPVKLEDCDVPRRLTQYQWVDVFRQDGYKRLMLGLQKRASGLGADVSPVVLDETRRTPRPEKKKSEEPIVSAPSEEKVKEELLKKEISVSPQEEKEPEVKLIQQKPFTKLLDPSSLSSQKRLQPQGDVPIAKTSPKQKSMRWLSVGGIILVVLIFSGFGLNYLVNNSPELTATVFPTHTLTPKPPKFTSVPFTKTPIPTPTLGIGSTMVSEKDGMILAYVPAGEFTMGNDSRDLPIHRINLDAFWIDQTEVTNAMYAKCVDSGKCNLPINSDHFSNSKYAYHPVVYVDWNMANEYCSWAGRRLPTEAEWEKAARGTDERTYPWGEGIDCGKANYGVCVGGTSPVGSFADGISPYGAYDMAGNALEWVSSLIKPYPYDANDGRENMNSSGYRVVRGGGWNNYSEVSLYSAGPIGYVPTTNVNFIGFRCAHSAK